MRKFSALLFFLFSFLTISAQDIPNPISPPRLVNDFAGLFTAQEKEALENKLRAYNDSTSTQIYVVVVSSFNGYDRAYFAYTLGEKWGVGQKGKNNGAVVLVKPKTQSERGEIFIATGYGLEGALPDAITKRITDQTIIPYFKVDKYYEGVNAGIDAMIGYLQGEYKADSNNEEGFPMWLIVVIIIVIIIIIISSDHNEQDMNRRGSRNSGGTIFFPTSSSGRSSGGGFGGFSGGGGGGGFSGGGGGSFGGGGAGGSW